MRKKMPMEHRERAYTPPISSLLNSAMGFIDKYMDDGLMALFGLNPEREQHPCADAVSAALVTMDVPDEIIS